MLEGWNKGADWRRRQWCNWVLIAARQGSSLMTVALNGAANRSTRGA